MTDREKLLTALLSESEHRAGATVSVLDVIAMLDELGAEHRRATPSQVALVVSVVCVEHARLGELQAA